MNARGTVRTAPSIDGISLITRFNPPARTPVKRLIQPNPSPKPTMTEILVPELVNPKPSLLSKIRPLLSILIAIIVFALSSFVLYTTWSRSRESVPPSSNQSAPVVASDREGQDETLVSDADIDGHKVAPDLPRIIKIDKIGVRARVLPMGVKSNNQLMAPENIYDTGWYMNSAKPGEKGAMLIDGHYSGPTRAGGIFSKIKVLMAGDIITVEKGDGSSVKYEIQKIESIPKESVDMGKMLTPYGSSQKGLNMITCDGQYDPKTNTYDNRTVVFASMVE